MKENKRQGHFQLQNSQILGCNNNWRTVTDFTESSKVFIPPPICVFVHRLWFLVTFLSLGDRIRKPGVEKY